MPCATGDLQAIGIVKPCGGWEAREWDAGGRTVGRVDAKVLGKTWKLAIALDLFWLAGVKKRG